MRMNRILIFILLMLCALFAAGQNNRIVSEGGGSNQDLEFDVATGILSITNGTGDTIPVMAGATAEENGASGLAPQPLAGQESLFLRGDGTYANPSTGGDNWGSQVVQKTARFSGDGTAGTPLELAQQSASSGQVLKWNGSSWAPAADTDTNTDAQTLSIASNSLSITGGNSVDLSPYLDNTDAQTLSLATNTLSITGGNSVSLAAYLDNTDAQTLTFTESTRVLAISGGNSPDLSEGIQEEVNALIVAGTGISKGYNDGGNTLTISSTVTDTDDQTLSLAGTLLSISEGNSVDIAGVDTDGQTLSFTSPNLSISGGNSVNLSELLDNQVIDVFQISSNTLQLSLEGDAEAPYTVNLAPYLDNTDAQTLSYNAGTDEITISGGNTIDISEVDTDTDEQGVDVFSLSGTTLNLSLENDGAATYTVDLSSLSSSDGNGIISALPAGDVVVNAAGINGLMLNNMDTMSVEATTGLRLWSPNIWLANDVDIWGGLGYDVRAASVRNIATSVYYGGVNGGGDVTSTSTNTVINGFLDINLLGHPRLVYASSHSSYSAGNEGRLAFNNSTLKPMFWTGSAWEDLVGSSSASTPMNYLEVGASSTSTPAFSTTFSKLTHLTAGDDSGADWAWSTGTDLATYSGSTKVGFIYFSLSFRVSSTFNEITFVIRENGSETMAKAIVESLDAGVEHTASGVALVTFNNGDTFELGGYSQSGTPNVTVRHCNMTFFSFN